MFSTNRRVLIHSAPQETGVEREGSDDEKQKRQELHLSGSHLSIPAMMNTTEGEPRFPARHSTCKRLLINTLRQRYKARRKSTRAEDASACDPPGFPAPFLCTAAPNPSLRKETPSPSTWRTTHPAQTPIINGKPKSHPVKIEVKGHKKAHR